METGDGGLENMLDELGDCRVMFGYLRCTMPDGRPKFVQVRRSTLHSLGKLSLARSLARLQGSLVR